MGARLVILLVYLTFSAASARAEGLLVFAAASLKEPMDQIADAYGNVTVTYGGSGLLARQVIAGAPADVVVLANAAWMDVIEDAGILATPPIDILSNRLVLIAPAGQPDVALTAESLAAALAGGRLATGRVDSVPAGIYGRAALENLDMWTSVKDRLAEIDNVRAALALVARKEAPLGIAYATDARVSDAVTVVATFPATSHPAIRYTAAAITPEAIDFVNYLSSAEAQSVFMNAGFVAVGAVE